MNMFTGGAIGKLSIQKNTEKRCVRDLHSVATELSLPRGCRQAWGLAGVVADLH